MIARAPPSAREAESIIAAGRMRAQQRILAGLLHDLNGPLNNLGLTLQLLERVLAQRLGPAADEGERARLRRYLDTFAQEIARAGACVHAAAGVLSMTELHDGPASLDAIVGDVARLLRHHATLAAVRLEVLSVAGGGPDIDHPAPVRDALLSFASAAIALCQSGGRVSIARAQCERGAAVHIVITPPVDAATIAPTFEDGAMPSSEAESDLVAGRLQFTAMRGASRVRTDGGGTTIEVVLAS